MPSKPHPPGRQPKPKVHGLRVDSYHTLCGHKWPTRFGATSIDAKQFTCGVCRKLERRGMSYRRDQNRGDTYMIDHPYADRQAHV